MADRPRAAKRRKEPARSASVTQDAASSEGSDTARGGALSIDRLELKIAAARSCNLACPMSVFQIGFRRTGTVPTSSLKAAARGIGGYALWKKKYSTSDAGVMNSDYRDIQAKTFNRISILQRYKSSVRRKALLQSVPPTRSNLKRAFLLGVPYAGEALQISAHEKIFILSLTLAGVYDAVLWYARAGEKIKYRQIYFEKADMQSASLYKRVADPSGTFRTATREEVDGSVPLSGGAGIFRPDTLTSQSSPESATFKVGYLGNLSGPGKGGWKTNPTGMSRLKAATRLFTTTNRTFQYVRRMDDFNVAPINNVWTDVGTGSFTAEKLYVVQTRAASS